MSAYTYYSNASQNSSQRPLAAVLALVSAVVLSPLYNAAGLRSETTTKPSSGFVLPMILAGLVIAIRTASTSGRSSVPAVEEACWLLRIGSSSWGLAGVLVMLAFVLSWQHSVKQFFWR